MVVVHQKEEEFNKKYIKSLKSLNIIVREKSFNV